MTRAMKHGVPVDPEAMLGPDGKPMTCVVVGKSVPFARACVDLMNAAEPPGGKSHRWKLGLKAFWVPQNIIELARERVEGERQ